jgi:hypothetical protein
MTKHQKATMGLSIEDFGTRLNTGLPNFEGEAVCGNASIDPDLFFSEKPADIVLAKGLCAACPVQKMCLDYALRVTEYGVWGGLTARERVKLKRQRKIYVDDTTTQLENARLLRSSATAAELAQRFNVSERTIQRWRKDLAKQSDASGGMHFSAPSRSAETEAA